MKIKTNKVTDCDRISPRAIKGLCPISEFFNPRTFKGGGGGTSWMLPPRVFLTFLLEDKTLASDVFGSSSFIPRAHFESNSLIVSFYGYEKWCHKLGVVKPFLWIFEVQVWRVKVHVFSTIKVNLVAKIMQSAYLFAIFHLKHKKITISRGFNLISNSW